MVARGLAIAALSLCVLASCARRPANPVEDPSGKQDVSGFTLTSLRGTRDGERLGVQAVFGDSSRALIVDLQFKVGPQTRLSSGTWTGFAGAGSVRERSVTFLGGQSGPPSIGGRFDLHSADDRLAYTVTIPLQPLNRPL